MTFLRGPMQRPLLAALIAVWTIAGFGSAHAGGVNFGNDEDGTSTDKARRFSALCAMPQDPRSATPK